MMIHIGIFRTDGRSFHLHTNATSHFCGGNTLNPGQYLQFFFDRFSVEFLILIITNKYSCIWWISSELLRLCWFIWSKWMFLCSMHRLALSWLNSERESLVSIEAPSLTSTSSVLEAALAIVHMNHFSRRQMSFSSYNGTNRFPHVSYQMWQRFFCPSVVLHCCAKICLYTWLSTVFYTHCTLGKKTTKFQRQPMNVLTSIGEHIQQLLLRLWQECQWIGKFTRALLSQTVWKSIGKNEKWEVNSQ